MAPQKRSAEEAQSIISSTTAILLDIEGTTTPSSFVKDQLFPYVKDNIETYLTNHYDEEETQNDIKELRELAQKDKEGKEEGVVEIPEVADGNKDEVVKATIGNVAWQMEKDRKTTALKQLQGHIWREAYKQGKVKGDLYEDVAPALQHMVEEDMQIFIFSSGSIEAQKLLFGNSTDGDLLELLAGFYDTTIGCKTDVESYKKIAEDTEVEPEEFLFLTDCPEEAAASVKAGMKCALVKRPGNPDFTEEQNKNFLIVDSLCELFPDEDEEDVKRLAGDDNGDFDDEDDEEEEDLEGEEEEEEGEGEEEEGA